MANGTQRGTYNIVRIACGFTPAQFEILSALANVHAKPFSAVVREIVAEYIKRMPK